MHMTLPSRRRFAALTLAAALVVAAPACRGLTGPSDSEVTAVATGPGMLVQNSADEPVCIFAISKNAVAHTDYILGECHPDAAEALRPGETRLLRWENLGAPADRDYWLTWWTGPFDTTSGRVHSIDVSR